MQYSQLSWLQLLKLHCPYQSYFFFSSRYAVDSAGPITQEHDWLLDLAFSSLSSRYIQNELVTVDGSNAFLSEMHNFMDYRLMLSNIWSLLVHELLVTTL